MNITTFVENKTIRQNSTYIRSNGEGVYIYAGTEFPEKLFDKLYPIKHNGRLKTFRDYPKGSNPDKTRVA